jgi:hypothetical protein
VALVQLGQQTVLAGLTLYFLQLPRLAVVAVEQALLLMARRFLEVQAVAGVVAQVPVVEHLEPLTKDVLAVMQLV